MITTSNIITIHFTSTRVHNYSPLYARKLARFKSNTREQTTLPPHLHVEYHTIYIDSMVDEETSL